MRPSDPIRIGTRGSNLALRQSEIVRAELERAHPDRMFILKVVETRGDKVQDRPIRLFGDKGVFVRTIELALLSGEVDLAVHSLKDLPADVETPGLALTAFSAREDPRDVLISSSGRSLRALPSGARVGTSSLRRRVQLLALQPDVVPADIRGNVDTRLRKLDAGEYDALLLAAAGLHRLGLQGRITEYLSPDTFVPDAGQGIIAVQSRRSGDAADLAAGVDHPASRAAAVAERAVVRALNADCHSPVGAYARLDGERITVRAVAAAEDGVCLIRDEESGPAGRAEAVGRTLGQRLTSRLQEIPAKSPPA